MATQIGTLATTSSAKWYPNPPSPIPREVSSESNLQFLQKKLSLLPRPVAEAILIDPEVMHGNPVFKGTRIPIYQIVEEIAGGTPFEQLTEGYPSLDSEKVRRGLDFVASLLRIYDEEIPH